MKPNRKVRHHFFLALLKRQLKKPGFYLIVLLCLFFLYVFVQVVFPSVARQEFGGYIGDTRNKEQLRAVLKEQEGAEVTSLEHMNGIADYICSTSTLKGELLKEKVFAAILQVVSGNLLAEMGRNGTVYEEQGEEIAEELEKYYQYYLLL